MAKPAIKTGSRWQNVEPRNEADHPLSVLTGIYGDGTKEMLVPWKLNWWERIKVFFTGEIYLHCLEQLPLHKISLDHKHVKKMIEAWNGNPKAMQTLVDVSPNQRKQAFQKINKGE